MNLLQEMFAGKLADLGFGGAIGVAAGYAAKKATRLTLLMLGALFIIVQLLAYVDLIQIRWDVVESFFRDIWFDAEGSDLGERAWMMLTSNLPFGGAFVAGFLVGFRMG